MTGADISPTAVAHARTRYAGVANLEFREADCAALPFADASFDVVVSFETIEHIAAQEAFLDEIRRVLRPDGVRRDLLPQQGGIHRPARSRQRIPRPRALSRRARGAHRVALPARRLVRPAAEILLGGLARAEPGQGEIFEVSEAAADAPSAGHARPLYFIVVASGSAEAPRRIAPRMSVLADRDEWVYRDYEKVMRAYVARRSSSNRKLVDDLRRELVATQSRRAPPTWSNATQVIAEGCASATA